MTRVSVREVARVAGVSPKTASLALLGNPHKGKGDGPFLSDVTVARISAVAKSLGYKVDKTRGRFAEIPKEPVYDLRPVDVGYAKQLGAEWARDHGFDQGDCISEALYAAVRAARTYRADKGTFVTHLYWTVKSRLRVTTVHRRQKDLAYGYVFFSGMQNDSGEIEDVYDLIGNLDPGWIRLSNGFSLRGVEVRDLLSLLTRDDRELVQFVFLDGGSLSDLAFARGSSVAAVQHQVDEILSRLKAFLVRDRMILEGRL